MPAYDYRCTQCGDLFEVVRPMGENSDQSCPACDSPAIRVFGTVGVAFKGSGFHNTDYKTRPAEKCESSSESSG